MPQSQNAILMAVNPGDMGKLGPHLNPLELRQGQVLVDSGHRVNLVYFPHGGILSCVVQTRDGSSIETGMIGRDGVFGGIQALDDRKSMHKVMVQVPCLASVIEARFIKAIADSSPDFRGLLVRYEQFFFAQVQQTAACNALHDIKQRTCKWLLRMYDLAGPELPLTQEFLAQMMGVRRTSVTAVAHDLQTMGLISYRRGKVCIQNVEEVRRHACECAEVVQEYYSELVGRLSELAKRPGVATAFVERGSAD